MLKGHLTKSLRFFLILLIVETSCNDDKSEKVSGRSGCAWDIVYIQNEYVSEPTEGYYFRPDGMFYAFYYMNGKKVPFEWGRFDDDRELSLNKIMKHWSIVHDSMQMKDFKYKIEYFRNDTISLLTGIPNNPIIKLAKSER